MKFIFTPDTEVECIICSIMANTVGKTILKFIRSLALICGAIWLTIAHVEAFTIDYYFYGYAVWGICIIFSHYYVLRDGKSLFAAIMRYFSVALVSITLILLLYEFLKYVTPYHSLKDIIHRAPVCGYIEISLYVVCLIFGLIFILKKRGTMYNPIYRISFFYIFHITIIYCVAVRAYWCYELFLKPKEVILSWPLRIEPISDYTRSSYQSVIACIGGYFINKFYREKQAIFKAPKSKKYALFLRSFQDDEKVLLDKSLSDFYRSRGWELIQVADPSKASYNKSFFGKNLFIMSPDWKKELSYCISCAEHITLCLGSSEGVQWEMYAHAKYLDKYLFFVPEKAVLLEQAGQIYQNYADTQVAEAINGLRQVDSPSLYFIIKDDKCYYSEKFETLIDRDCLDDVRYINLQSRLQEASAREITDKESASGLFSCISLKQLSIPVIALCPLLVLSLDAKTSVNSIAYIVFLIICYISAVAIIIKRIKDTEK